MAHKKGARVRQVMPKPVEGVVVQYGEHGDGLGYRIVDDNGEDWWFNEDQVEAVPTEAPADADTPNPGA